MTLTPGGAVRILVLATAARWGGALSVLRSLHEFAVTGEADHEWVFLVGSDLLEPSAGVRIAVDPQLQRSRSRRLLLEAGIGTASINRWQPDVVLSLQNTMPRRLKARTVLYVQQSVPFQKEFTYRFHRREERSLAVYQHLIGALTKRSIRSSDLVVVQSQWMREAVLAATEVPSDRLIVAAPELPALELPEHRAPFDPLSFVYPTYGQRYKNNEAIYEACRMLTTEGLPVRAHLTITGGVMPGVAFTGHLPRAEFVELLSHSTLLFPSYYETVGLPLLEARALGVPVLAADRPYAREMVGDYANAAFFDPDDPRQLADLMRTVATGGRTAVPPQPMATTGGWPEVMRAIEAL